MHLFSGLYLPDVLSRCQFTLKPKNVSGNHKENDGGRVDVVGILSGFLGAVKPFENKP